MALTRKAWLKVKERVKVDPEYRTALLKELLREAVMNDPDLLEKVVNLVDHK